MYTLFSAFFKAEVSETDRRGSAKEKTMNRKNWLKKTIAMLTLVATVLETGFSSVVPVFASELLAVEEETLGTNIEAGDEALADEGSSEDDLLTENPTDLEDPGTIDVIDDISVEKPKDDDIDLAKAGTIDVSDNGITGSGFDFVSVYINTDNLANEDKFSIKFTGPNSAVYNPVLNDELDKTNGGRYNFENLGGSDFGIRAISEDDVIISYENKDGYPVIVVQSGDSDKVLTTKILTAVDDTKISAVSGKGYESITVKLDTEDLSDKEGFKFYVESNADATVDGKDAVAGIGGLTKADTSLKIENLEGQSFVAYVVAEEGSELETVAEITSVEDGTALIDINGVATKRVYEYEDNKVYVRTTLEKADAIPDDAYFCVTPLLEEEAERYLEALNSNRDEDTTEYTAENTLLYDIAFYTDESKSEEIEPEEGSVTVSFEFKNDQLAGDIGAEYSDDIVVTHIKEDGSQVTAETVDAEASVDGGVVEFTTDSFSLYAITNIRDTIIPAGQAVTYRDILMGAVNYGLVGNTIELENHIDSNLAAKLLKTSADNATQGQYTGKQNPGNTIIAAHQGNKWHIDSANGKSFIVYTTEEAAKSFKDTAWKSYAVIDTSIPKDNLVDMVDKLVNGTLSAEFANNEARNSISSAVKTVNGQKVIDISKEAGGTYIIDFASGDVGEGGKYFNSASSTRIKLNSNQTIVLNIPDQRDMKIHKFDMDIVDRNKSISSDTSTSYADEFCRHVVWNFYNQNKVTTLQAVLGIFLAPKGTLYVTGTSTGWAVADRIKNNGGEWHCVWDEMPEPKRAKLKIPVNKHFIGGSGNWGQDGFRFKLERLDYGSKKVDTSFQPQYIRLNGGDSEYDTGIFELPEISSDQINWNNTKWDYGCDKYLEQWYRISEVDENGNLIDNVRIRPRAEVTYNIYDANEPMHGYPNQPYWYVHVFWYRNSATNNIISVKRTARVEPNFNCYAGLPCIEDGAIEFVNKYEEIETEVELKGIKKINGSDATIPDNTFGFTLYEYKGNNTFGNAIQPEKFNSGSSVKFDKIKLKLGTGTQNETSNGAVTKSTWYYLIKETTCPSPYTKDESSFIAKVTAARNSSNKIVTSVEYYRFKKGDTINVLKAMNGDTAFKFSTCKFEYNNTYSAMGSTIIYGFKMLEGRFMDPDDEFTFKLTSSDDKQANAKQEKTFKVSQVTSEGFGFAFDELSYTLADDGKTYTYVVEEIAGNAKGVIYDSTKHTVRVAVKDGKNGKLIVTQDDGTKGSPLKFTNRYSADGKIKFRARKEYPVETELSRKNWFTFRLTGAKADGSNAIEQERKVQGPGEVEFGEIEYKTVKDVGTYYYKIKEVVPDDAEAIEGLPHKKIKDGIIYDDRTYNITVVVTDNKSGELQKAMTAGYDDEAQTAVTDVCPAFINDYRINPAKDPIKGKKSFPGSWLKRGMFTFELSPYGTVTEAAVADGTVVLPAVKVKNGIPESELSVNEFKFDDIIFNKAGTYQFLVKESKDDMIKDVVYSDAEFVITKVIEDNGKGDLKVVAARSYATYKGQTEKVDMEFINTPYNPGGIKLRAYKQLIGRKPVEGQFWFDLKSGDTVIDRASNNASGIALFKEIGYKLEDLGGAESKTFTYTIQEEIPAGAQKKEIGGKTVYVLNGYIYDGHIETVNVTVKSYVDNNGEGHLSVSADNGTEVDQAWFRNEYEAYGSVDLGGTKAITGRKFDKEDNGVWQAVLYDSTGKELQRVDITKETGIFGDAGAEFNFDALEFVTKAKIDPTQPGYVYDDYSTPQTFTYYVKEERNPNLQDNSRTNGMTDDTVVYNVKITVSDDGKGHLIIPAPELTRNDGSAVETMHFDNTFKADDTEFIEAHKKVTGTALEDKMFVFKLTDDQTGKEYTRTNDAGGNVKFENEGNDKYLTYDQDDVREEPYEYTINEYVKNRVNGWTYSEAEYVARIWVSLNKNNEIELEKKYFRKNADGTETEVSGAEVVFENTYEATGKVQPYAEKEFTGRDIPENTFWFVLTNEDGTYKDRKPAPATPAGKTAVTVFDEIEYTLDDLKADDTYKVGENKYEKYYYAWEEIPEDAVELGNGYYKKDGITYDGNRYKITVTLIDTKEGTIETDWTAAKASEPLKDLTLWEKFKKAVGWDDVQKHALFINTYDAEGNLELNALKILTGKELKAGDYSFTISGKDTQGKAFSYSKENKADGTVEFDRISFTKDDVGEYEYTIKENIPADAKKDENGVWIKDGVRYDDGEYVVKVNVSDPKTGKLAITASVNGSSDVTAVSIDVDGTEVYRTAPEECTFTNVYIPEPVVVTPGGRKDLQGRLLSDGEFEFHMVSDEGNPKSYDQKVRNQGQWFTFPSITFTPEDMKQGSGYAKEKTFAYTMTETKESLAGVTYSTAEYRFVIRVTDNNGILKAEVIRDDSSYKGTVPQNEIATFVNFYNAEGTVSFPVHKIVLGTNDKDKEFKFVLKDKQTNDEYTVFCKADETKTIASFDYKLEDLVRKSDGTYEPRVFKYEVYEEAPVDGGGWKYSRDVYYAEVTVSDNGSGELEVNSVVNGKDYHGEALDFTNEYNAEGDTDLKGKKLFPGGTLEGGEFSFILEEKTGTDENGNAVYGEPETVKNDANGDFAFADRHYTMADLGKTFEFRVKEDTSNPRKDIVYDGSVYDVVISVEDNKDGTLNVNKVVTKNGVAVKDCVFTYVNTPVEPDSIRITAEKVLEGLPLEDDMFTFTLTGDKNVDQTKTNNGTSIVFDPIFFTLEDAGKTFNYEVRETISNKIKGIKYDGTVKTVVAKVDLVDNKLVIDQKTYDNNVQIDNDQIKFINTYEYETSVPVGGSKILSGFPDDAPSIGQYPYTFALYDANGSELQKVTVTPKDNKTPVEYKFEDLKYTQDDYNDKSNPEHKFSYTVKELVPVIEKDKAPNVVYATNEYNIDVVLYITNDKELKAKATTRQNVPTDKLNFTNVYKADGSVNFPAVKTVTGKELEDAAYTFTLTGEGQDQTVTNNGNQINFEAIQYTQNDLGLHTYKIKETASKDGSTIDSREYTAEVTVEEGTNGKLKVNDPVFYTIGEDGNKVFVKAGEPIVFENTYKANGEIDIEGIKVMHSKPLAPGDFSFILKDENGKVIETVTHGEAKLNNKKDLEARAAFKFSPLKFTQEDLKSGGGYLPEIRKYYTIEEQISKNGGVTYSNAAYVVEVTIKDNKNGTLTVTKAVAGQKDVKKDETDNGLSDFLKALIGRMSGKKDDIVFDNYYDSVCTIDPPVLTKEMFGMELQRGMFEFEITGPGLRSKNESEYKVNVWNGINPVDGSYNFPNGELMDIGEIYPGNIQYRFVDLDIDLETGEASREFVYYAKEIDHSNDNDGIKFSDQILKLVVKVSDNNDGTLTVRNAKDIVVNNIEGDKEHKLFWQAVNPYTLNDEQMNDTFLNKLNQEGSIDIPGIKKMTGRALTKDDKFEFTITDEKGNSVTRFNTEDANGIPSRVEFNAKDKDGNIDIPFLNYRYGWYEKNPDRKAGEPADLYEVNDTGNYVYTITETSISSNNIKTDTATFKVYVEVKPSKDRSGKLSVNITNVEKIYTDNNKVQFDFSGKDKFEFTNEFEATGTVSFNAVKYLKDPAGRDGATDLTGAYKFALYQYDDASRTTGKTLVDTKATDKNGGMTLNVPTYTQETLKNEKGEYEVTKTLYYRIIESKPSDGVWTNNNTVFESNGVTFDNTEYDVDVKITNDGSSTLKIEKEIKKAATGETVTNISFTNIQNMEYTVIPVRKHWIHSGTELTGKQLANVPDLTFNLYSSAVGGGKEVINTHVLKSGELEFTFKTDNKDVELPKYDKNGSLITYTVEEVPVPGYLSEKKDYDFYNTDGDIRIQKIDADTNAPLEGATLAIYDGSTELDKWTSGTSAHVIEKEKGLKAGKTYVLRELKAPAGYAVAADISFTVPSDGSDITVTMKDKPIIGAVRLTKRDSATRDVLAGAEFALYDNDGTRIYATGSAGKYTATSKTSNGVFTTDASGVLVISDLPYGAYYFVETKAPKGYTLSSERLGFTIADAGKTVEVTYLNRQAVGSVRLRKVSASGERTLEGAEFELYSKTPRSAAQAISSTIFSDAYYRYGTYTTNSSGEIYVDNLPWDDYYFIETKAPEGFKIATDITGDPLVYTFRIDESTSSSTVDLGSITNESEDGEVLGERRPPESGVLGVRSKPKGGVLGTRVGPATGDMSSIALWLAAMLACIGTIVWLLIEKRRKRV